MNLIVLRQTAISTCGKKAIIVGRCCIHIIKVLKAGVGSVLRVGILNGNMGTGIITTLSDTAIEMEITLSEPPPPPSPITLICALPRPQILKRVIQESTALGIKKISLIRTWKVNRSYFSSPVLLNSSLEHECILGLEQAGDTIMPTITVYPLFRPFMEDTLPSLTKNKLCLLAHPTTPEPCPAIGKDEMVLAIGPEGGFSEFEIDMFSQQGFKTFSLGARILRVDHVIPYIAGILSR